MDLGADIAAALPMLRRQAESRMVDHCIIVESIDGGDPDPETGLPAGTFRTVYDGPCDFKAADTQALAVDSASRDLVQQGAVLKIPVDAPGSADVRAGHTATITLSTFDSTSSPVVARVNGTHQQTYATARRIPVEVTSNA